MKHNNIIQIAYFPGCSLATTSSESNQSLSQFCMKFSIHLSELNDWNCCGSSSAHSINSKLAFQLGSRILSLVPPDQLLLVACPSCYLRLKQAHLHLKQNPDLMHKFEDTWGKPFDSRMRILHFMELVDMINRNGLLKRNIQDLNGLKCAPYYGCMLFRPPEMRHEPNFYGLMEKVIDTLGGKAVTWPFASQCCGSFLTVASPKFTTLRVNAIVKGAIEAGADCIVTACAMCHLNLEIRCTIQPEIPIFHLSEMLALVTGTLKSRECFGRHLIDPMPVLRKKQLVA